MPPAKLLGLLCAAAAATGMPGCGLPDTPYFGHVPEVTEPGHLRYCNQGEPDALDPTMAATTVGVRLVQQMFEGLVIYDAAGRPVPGLAERWEVSSDQRTFTFHLRRGLRWSNGRALDAYDVGYQVVRLLHPTTASPNAGNAPAIANAAAFTARQLAVLRQDVGVYRAGQIVQIVEGDGRDQINLRQLRRPLPLRDLGAAVEAAYATVPVGEAVELIASSGGRLLPPAPDGQRWSYVYWKGDARAVEEAERYGWVLAAELEGDRAERVGAAARFKISPVAERADPAAPADPVAPADPAAPSEPAASAAPASFEVSADAFELSPEGVGVRVVDRHTIVFHNSTPAPYFLYLAVNHALRPTPHEVVSRWPRSWATPARIVTSGAMSLSLWKPRDRVELVRSPTYWDSPSVKLDKLTAYSFEDAAAATNYYYAGRCDAVATNQIPGSYLPALRGEHRGGRAYRDYGGRAYRDYKVAPFLSSYFVLLNVKQLANVHLRRALNLAIDRSVLPAITRGGEHPTAQITPGAAVSSLSPDERALCGVDAQAPQPGHASGPLIAPERVAMIMTPGALCYLPPPGLAFDPRRAAEELALARKELGAAFPSKLTYRYNEGSEVHKQIAEVLQAQWQRAGIPVEIQSQEWRSLVADTAQGNYQMARFGNAATFPDPATEYLELFACGSPFNRTGYCDDRFEQRLAEIRATADPSARNRKIYEAESQVVGDAVVIPLYVYTQRHLHKPYVRDLAINLVDQPPLYRAWLDPNWRTSTRSVTGSGADSGSDSDSGSGSGSGSGSESGSDSDSGSDSSSGSGR